MSDDEFNSLCNAHGFGAVASGECPLVSSGMLKVLVDAAYAAGQTEAEMTTDQNDNRHTPGRRRKAIHNLLSSSHRHWSLYDLVSYRA
jgi:hypothetical protein